MQFAKRLFEISGIGDESRAWFAVNVFFALKLIEVRRSDKITVNYIKSDENYINLEVLREKSSLFNALHTILERSGA